MAKRMLFIVIMILSIVINCFTSISYCFDLPISKVEAINIANNEVIKLGKDIALYNIKASKYNTPYNAYVPKNDEEFATDRNKLKNKKYWAIYYSYPSNMNIKGGAICVFIDYNTGNVINMIRMK